MATKQSVKLRRRAQTCATLCGWSGDAATVFMEGWTDGYAAAKHDQRERDAARKKAKRGKKGEGK